MNATQLALMELSQIIVTLRGEIERLALENQRLKEASDADRTAD